jgi:hypothetical protein
MSVTDHHPIPGPILSRRHVMGIAVLAGLLAVAALLATPLSRKALPRPVRDGLYNLGLTAKSPAVEDVEADVQRLRYGIRRYDRNAVQRALHTATVRFDALDPGERSSVGADVEVELLRGRQFLHSTTTEPPSVRPPPTKS